MDKPESKPGSSLLFLAVNTIETGYPDLHGEIEVSIVTQPMDGDHPVFMQITTVAKSKSAVQFLPQDIPLTGVIELRFTREEATLLGEFLQMATNVAEPDD
jgi:hypothetical protein